MAQLEIEKWTAENIKAADVQVVIDLIWLENMMSGHTKQDKKPTRGYLCLKSTSLFLINCT